MSRPARERNRGRRPRPIDLHLPWHLQYAGESVQYDPALYPEVSGRLGVLDGYLGTASAAILVAFRSPEDWSRQDEPWRSLADILTRLEAEFPGRLIRDADDLGRWAADPAGLCWGVLGVEGLDFLVREAADVEHLGPLFRRGVRVFQLVRSPESALGGPAEPDADRGLTDLGRACLARLLDLAPPAGQDAPRPILDLAHTNRKTVAEVLDWLEAEPDRSVRLPIVISHGAIADETRTDPRLLDADGARRLIDLGGVIGLGLGSPFHASAEALVGVLRSAVESRGDLRGLAIGSNLLRNSPPDGGPGGLDSWAAAVVAAMGVEVASPFVSENAHRLLVRAAGGPAD